MKRAAQRGFDLLMRTFPARFRDAFGDDMRESFVLALNEATQAGRGSVLRLLVRTTANMLAAGLSERFRPAYRPGAAPLSMADGPAGGRRRWSGSGISWLDLKLGLRMLFKYPGLTAVAVFALAVGIPVGLAPSHGARVLQAPPPFQDAHELQVVKSFDRATSLWQGSTWEDYTWWRDRLSTFEVLGAMTRGASFNLMSDDGTVAPVRGAEVTASVFEALRVGPLLGRPFSAADEVHGSPPVVILGYDVWQTRLVGDPDVVGSTVRVGGTTHTVVGVMPQGFRFPVQDQMWLPLRDPLAASGAEPGAAASASTAGLSSGAASTYTVFGRLAHGVSDDEARAEVAGIGVRAQPEDPTAASQLRPEVVPFTIGLFGAGRDGLQAEGGFFAFQMLALLVLVVAGANIAMLVFARTATRFGEVAVRTALGASRMRVVSQLFTEALVLSVAAAGIGLFAADQLASRRLGWLSEALPYWIDPGVTPGTVVRALGLAILSATVVGVVPALKFTGPSVQQHIQRSAAGRSGMRFGGISSALIITDVTLAVAAVGLAVGLSEGLTSPEDGMGIQAEQYLFAELEIPVGGADRNDTPAGRAEHTVRVGDTHRELLARLNAEPGISAAVAASHLPGMDHTKTRIEFEGLPTPTEGAVRALRARVDVDYFRGLEQEARAGRLFDLGDIGENRSAVVVNSSFVEHLLGGRNALGQRFRYLDSSEQPTSDWYEVVGVVGHLGMFAWHPPGDAGVYHAAAPGELHPIRVGILVGDAPESFVPRLRSLAAEVDPTAVLAEATPLDEVFSFNTDMISWIRLGAMTLIGILLALAASGTYALMSFTVAERTREIGIRTAMGAPRSRVFATIARRALIQVGSGVLLGMPIAGWMLAQFKNGGRIPGHSPLLLTLLLGAGVMLVIGSMACIAPTLRALRIRPTEALRSGG